MIILGIPTLGTVPIKVMASVTNVIRAYGKEVQVHMTENSLIYNARDQIAREALKIGADLVFIDSDIVFDLEDFEQLLRHKKPIVSGLYWSRKSPSFPVAYKKVRPKTWYRKYPVADHITDIEPFMEVDGAGMGFCLIRNEVLQAVIKEDRNAFEPFGAMGEDFSFFYRCKKKGYKVFLDTTLKLKHIGSYEYGR